MNFLYCLKGEYLKSKGTILFWLVFLGGILVPTISFCVQLFKPLFFISRAQDPWGALIGDIFSIAIPLLLPFFIILFVVLNFNIDHKANAWKKLFVVPHHRATIYLSKVIFILIQFTFSLLMFLVAIVFYGNLLGIIHPELNFLNTTIDWGFLLKSLVKIWLGYLALVGFQVLLSFSFKNLIVPISIGLFGFISGSMLIKWEYSMYNFLSNNVHLNFHLGKRLVLDFTLGIPTYQFFSVLYFVLFITIGWFLFNRKAL